MNGKYDDIINLPRYISTARKPMTTYNRAAQFSPFAALTGYEAAIKETARLTTKKIQLSKDIIARLDLYISIIAENIKDNPMIAITYFKMDDKKSGGAYVSTTGIVKKIDEYKKVIVLTNKESIAIEDIYEIEGEIFKNLNI